MTEKDVKLISGKDVHREEPDCNGKGTPTQFNWPSLHLLSGASRAYSDMCVALTNAALKGDIEEAKRLLGKNQKSLLCAAITEGYETILHVAAGAGQVRFVQEIVKLMEPEDLMLQDINGNTAFCFAAMIGNLQTAKILQEKNASLLTVRGGKNMTPLYLATLFGHHNMAKFLYRQTKQNLKKKDRKAIFLVGVNNGLYDLALALLEDDAELAVARHVQYGSALHMLAQKPSAFISKRPGLFKRLINWFPGMKFADQDNDMISTPVRDLFKCLWKEILRRQDEGAMELIRNPSNLLFHAAELGNYEFLAEITQSYPDLVHELDENGRSIFHIAVLGGHTNVLNLIHGIGFAKELLTTYVDKYQNNILHLAAKYHHPSPVTTVSSAALQMQRELLKFKEVEKIVKPYYKEMKNSEGKTPRQLFSIEHRELLKSAEISTQKTASSCLIIASLVTVTMFLAAFSLKGGNNIDETGISIKKRETFYQVFTVVNAVALSCSSTSMLIFLSILTSRCAEDDFLKLLPLKWIVGISGLYISILAMLIAFFSVFFIP